MNEEILRGVPPGLLVSNRYVPFTQVGSIYRPLMGKTVLDDVTNLSPQEVRKMPADSLAFFNVLADGRIYPMQVVKGESIPCIESVRLVSGEDDRFKFEAHLRRPRSFRFMMKEFGFAFADALPSRTLAVSFDITAKVDGRHHRPMRAKLFLRWAMEVFREHKPTHVLAEWEPTSDNHDIFYRALAETNDPIKAVESTWTHKQYAALGFRIMPGVSILDVRELSHGIVTTASPHGHPPTVVRVLYQI